MNLDDMSPEEAAKLQQEQCIFCKIISGQIPSNKVYEDGEVLCILDINPANEGHLLLLPKKHYQIMPQIPENELGNLFIKSKKLSNVLLQTFQTGGTSIFVANGGVAGQKAPHFMIHIMPRKKDDGLFNIPKKEADKSKLLQIQDALIVNLSKAFGRNVVQPKKEVKPEDQPNQIQIPQPNKGNKSGNSTVVQQTQPNQIQIPQPNKGNKSGDTNIVQQTQPNEDNKSEETQQNHNLQEETNDKPKSKSETDLDKISEMFLK